MQEDLCGALDNKNPSIKAETASFLARAFARTPPSVLGNKKILKAFIAPLLKTLNESGECFTLLLGASGFIFAYSTFLEFVVD